MVIPFRCRPWTEVELYSASEGEGRGAQERELGMGGVGKGRYSRGRVCKVRCEVLQWCKGVCWGFSTAVIFIMPMHLLPVGLHRVSSGSQ